MLDQFLFQFCASLEVLPEGLAEESLELVLAHVIWSYNNETSQPILGGLTPVAFRKRFFEKTRHCGEHGLDFRDGTNG